AIVCVTNDLATDQRVRKTCLTLQKCGYKVLETGRLLPDSLPFAPPYSIRRKRHWVNKGALFYAEYNIRLFLFLLFAKVDLIYSNDLDTLLACYLASKIRNKQLIYDTHEYFTEVPELISRPKVQRIWKRIENWIFPKLTKIITVNQSIADIYQKEYGKKVAVVRNIPLSFQPKEMKTREELQLPTDKKIIIIQGSGINIDRGAEETIQAMQYLADFVLLIVGNGDVIPTLKNMVKELNLSERVIFKSKMSFEQLRQHTINADLGLAMDKAISINYQYALPNKLFDYIHSNIPILTNQELVEISKIIEEYKIGVFIENHTPKHIAEVIKNLFSDKEKFNQLKENTLIAKNELCWEKEEQELIKVIKK
ncbi:MAG: glycosyltransferase, partial [Paludibacter sp.]